jgi:hypothetical protein
MVPVDAFSSSPGPGEGPFCGPSRSRIIRGVDWDKWLGLLAELLVAFVIYWELEGSRVERFVSEALDESAFGRRRHIYDAFCQSDASTLLERREALMRLLENRPLNNRHAGPDECPPDLRHEITLQIAVFSRAQTFIPWIQKYKVEDFVPHIAVMLWAMAYPLIQERRQDAGPSWGRPFAKLVSWSLSVLTQSAAGTLTIRDPDSHRNNSFRIDERTFVRLRDEVDECLRS